MSFHITPLFFTQAMRACTAIFAACYLLLLVTTFPPTRSWRLRFCGALWAGLFLQYVLSFVGTRLDVRELYWFRVTVILVDLIQLTSLVLIAETLPVADSASSRQTFVRTRRIGISAALLLALATRKRCRPIREGMRPLSAPPSLVRRSFRRLSGLQGPQSAYHGLKALPRGANSGHHRCQILWRRRTSPWPASASSKKGTAVGR